MAVEGSWRVCEAGLCAKPISRGFPFLFLAVSVIREHSAAASFTTDWYFVTKQLSVRARRGLAHTQTATDRQMRRLILSSGLVARSLFQTVVIYCH